MTVPNPVLRGFFFSHLISFILPLTVRFDGCAMKILQIGCGRLFSKYLITSKVDAVNSAKMHVSFVYLLFYMRIDCSHSIFNSDPHTI